MAELSSSEIGGRAVKGIVSLLVRGSAVRALGLVGYLVLARLLTPAEFGTLALGITALAVVDRLMFGGLGASLIRRSEPPSAEELRSVVWFQVGVSGIIAGGLLLIAPLFGTVGTVTAIMMIALPITSVRVASGITCERNLRYGPIVATDLVETVVYFTAAIALVAGGFGVYGVAFAALIRALVGVALMLVVVPEGRLRPGLSWAPLRALLGFGVRFQMVSGLNVVRDQLLSITIAATGGLAVLGLWTLAYRVLQVPYMVLQSLWQVSYPAFSRLRDAGDDIESSLERWTRLTTLAIATLFALTSSVMTPLIVPVFGVRWQDAANAIPPAMAGLILLVPGGVVAVGYLYARGKAQSVVNAVAVSSVTWLLVAAVGVPLAGVGAIGIGWASGCLLETGWLTRSVRTLCGARLFLAAGPPAVVGWLGIAAGWAAGTMTGGMSAVAASIGATGLTLVVLTPVLARTALRDAHRAVRGRLALRRPAAAVNAGGT